MGNGNVGSHLSSDVADTNTYLSRDGGTTWTEVMKGNYIFEFGNHGGILIMARLGQESTELFYSLDEGLNWQTLKYSGTPMIADNVQIEEEAKSMDFVLYG